MKRRVLARASAAAIVVALALPAMARAPSDQYDVYGAGDAIIRDAQTHLVWQRGFASAATWDDADLYCRSLSLAGTGVGGWRLPSMKELSTLVDEVLEEEYVSGVGIRTFAIDRSAFPNTPSGAFWAWPKSVTGGWSVHFDDGHTAPDNAGQYVRCVH